MSLKTNDYSHVLCFVGPIMPETTAQLRDALCALTQTPEDGGHGRRQASPRDYPSKVLILISSSGGDMEEAIALHYFLKAMPYRIDMHNIGVIGSCAVLVFLAGESRSAADCARFLIHDIRSEIGRDLKTLHDVAEDYDILKTDREIFSKIFAQCTENEDIIAQLKGFMLLSAAEAQEMKLIGAIGDPGIRSRTPILNVGFPASDEME